MLTSHNVPYTIPCCACDPLTLPVRATTDPETDAVTLEFWDCAQETPDWSPIEIATLEVVDLSVSSITSRGAVVDMNSPVLQGHGNAVAKNVTAAVTAAELARGYITSTSAAAVTITLPTMTLFATATGAVAGDRFQFLVDNSAGANTVTVDLTGSGVTVGTAPITGGDTLTVSVANAVGLFELFFTSTTAAIIRRIA